MKIVAALALVSTMGIAVGVAFYRRWELRTAEQHAADKVREARVRYLAAMGTAPREIAQQTGLTPERVETVLTANPTRRRLGARSQAEPAPFPFA
ncbi:MAG: hypothetical protein M3068_04525 [Gemmatimonadota bacterium]|nr:hypothetical protein [Gemmatimonadota bacterium]